MTFNPSVVFHRRGYPCRRIVLIALPLLGLLAFAGGCASHHKPPRPPSEYAADLFNTSNPDRRREAIAYFQDHPYGNSDVYVKSYILLATDPDPMVRAQSMRALGATGRYDVADTLSTGMKDANVQVRRDAVTGAKNVNNPTLIDPLIERVQTDADSQVRAAAVQALRPYTMPKVLHAYADALNDTDAAVAYFAYQNLQQVTGEMNLAMDQRAWNDYLNRKYPAKT
jgi:hypothetical protein